MIASTFLCACARLLRAVALLILFAFAQAAPAAEGVARRGSIPAFVVPIDIPAPKEKRLRQVDGAIYELLHDTQVRVDGGLETTYRRRAYKVLDRSALEAAAQISLKFDPSYENLVLHRIAILRDGRTIDVTSASDLDTIRQEEDLDDGVLTGTKTTLVRLPDVRVGDVIDASWSWVSRPPLWPDQYFANASLGWSIPLGLTRFRLDLPAGTPLRMHRYRGAPAPAFERIGGRDVREWLSTDPEPITEDASTPQWHRPWPRVAMSTMRQWGDVVAWARPLYAATDRFPQALESEAERIERGGGGPELKAVKALRYVQDRIRYTSLSIGTGSYTPRSPAAVIASGWGDCKDKAQLLVTLLRRLGIEAWPALTDTDEGAALRRETPSPGAFDHVIVQVRIGGKTYWVDPTIAHQGGTLATQAPLPYGFALPLRSGQRGLEVIPLPAPSAPDMDVVETYRFTPQGIGLEVTTFYTGAEADSARARFAGGAIADREAEYLRYYAESLPGLELEAPLAIRDDRSANRLVVRESYRLPAEAYADGALLDEFPISASTLGDIFTYPRGARRHPLALSHPIRRSHKIVFVTPGLSVSPPEEVSVDGNAFSFDLSHEREGDTLTITFSLTGKTPVLAPEDFAAYRKDADALAANGGWTLFIAPGAAMGDVQALTFGLLFLVLLTLLVLGFLHARAQKDAEKEREAFYPVPPAKFLLLSVATWGIYQHYWFWRHWRWVRRHEAPAIMPFWRAFFGIFWLYPLFSSASGRAARPLPAWLGAGAAALFLLIVVGTSLADGFMENNFAPTAVGFLACFAVLPALVSVNRANAPEEVRANGHWNWLAMAAFPTGLAAIILLLAAP